MPARLLLVDDHKMMIEGLRLILQKEKDLTVVAEAENGEVAVRLAEEFSPDVVVMDIAMPHLNGIDAIRIIMERLPAARVLVLSMHSDKQLVMEALDAGARGYLLKECAAEELVEALRTVLSSGIYICRRMAGVIVQEYLKKPLPKVAPSPLTSRENEILRLIADGRSTKEIAFTMGISVKTVETFRRLIMKKLRLYTVADLTKYAIRQGLTSVSHVP